MSAVQIRKSKRLSQARQARLHVIVPGIVPGIVPVIVPPPVCF